MSLIPFGFWNLSTPPLLDFSIYVGGSFTTYQGTDRNRISRLNANGSYDSLFDIGVGFNFDIRTSSIQSDSKIIVGGAFTGYQGTSANRIIALNTDGSYDSAFNIGTGFDNIIYTSSIQSDGKIILAGQFTTYQGTSRNRIARLNTDGSNDSTFNVGTGFSNVVYTSSIQSDGKIILGGLFSNYQGADRFCIVRLNTDGSNDTSFNIGTGFSNTVRTISIQSDGKIIVGGQFTTYQGTSRNRIARLNTDGSNDTSFNIGTGFNSIVWTTSVQSDGKIIIGGEYTTYQDTIRFYLVRLNTDGSTDSSFNLGTGFNLGIYTSSVQSDGKIIVGGLFTTYQGVSRNRIARLNTDGSYDETFNIGTGFDNPVQSLSIQSDGKILLGGQFSSYNGISINRLVRLNTDGSYDSSFNIRTGFDNIVYTTSIQSGGKIIVGGQFTTYNPPLINRITRLNTDGSNDTTFNIGTGFNSIVWNSSIQSDGKIIVGGQFTTYQEVAINRVAILNTDGSNDSSFNIGTGFNNIVMTSSIQSDGKIIVGGLFTTYQGTTRNRIVRLNTDASYDTSFNIGTGFNNIVNTSSIQSDNKIILGGGFTSYNPPSIIRIARLNTDASYDSSFDIGTGFNNIVSNFSIQSDGKIIFGGTFTTYRGNTVNRIVRLNTDGSYDSSFNIGIGFNLDVINSAIQSDGKVLVGGAFTAYQGTSRNRIVRLNTDGSYDSTFNIGTGFNSNVEAFSIQSDQKIIVGGRFTTYQGVSINRIVRLNTDGSTDSSFNVGTGFNFSVFSLSLQSDGKVIVGGAFTTYQGTTANRIARLNTDGSLDSSFNTGTGFNSEVYRLAIQSDGKIIFGGIFTTYQTISRSRIARLNTDGSYDTSFDIVTGFNSTIFNLNIQSDGKIIVGGAFTTYQGTTRNFIVRLNTDASYDTSFNIGTGFNNIVYTSYIQPDGKIVFGGAFTEYNPPSINRIARLNTDASYDTSFNIGTGFNNIVNTLSIQSDGKIIFGGDFTTYNQLEINRIARLNTDGSYDSSFDIGIGFNNFITNYSVQSDGKIIFVGQFTQYKGNLAYRIVRLNTDASYDSTFNTGSGFNFETDRSAIQSDGKIIVGGQFTTYQGVSRNRIARLNTDGSYDDTFNIGTGFDNMVDDFSIQSDGKIIVGGRFTTYQGVSRNRIVRLNTDGSTDSSFNIGTGFNNHVHALSLQSDGKVIVGGAFTTYQGTTRNRIVRLNTDGSYDTTFNISTGFNLDVYRLAIQSDGKVIVGGAFTTYQGVSRNRIARLNTDASYDSTFNIGTGFNSNILSLFIQSDGKVIVGGEFTTYQGTSRVRIARLNTDGSYDTNFNTGTGFNNIVYSLYTQPDGKIIVGGLFTTYNPPLLNRIARLNTDASLDSTFNIGAGFNFSVWTTSIQSDGKVIVGGDFTTYQGTSRNYIVRLNTDGSYDTTFNIGTGFNLMVYTSSIQSDGKIILAGQFTTYQGTSRNRIARLNTDGSYDTSFNVGNGFNNIVYTSSIQSDGKVVVGGLFSTYQEPLISRIIRLNTDASYDTSFNIGTGFIGGVTTTTIQSDGKVIVGGAISDYNGTSINRLIRLNTDGSTDSTFSIGTGFNSTLWTTSIQSDGKVIVGGQFTTYQGTTRNRIVRLNTDGSYDTSFNISTGFNSIVYTSSIQSDGTIVLGGAFTTYQGTTRNYIVRLNTDGSYDTNFNIGTGFNSTVWTSSIQSDGKIIVGGQFTTYQGTTRNRIVRLNTDGSYDTNFNIGTGFNLIVYSSSIQSDGKIIVGGTFTTYQGVSRVRIARLNTDGSNDTTFNVGTGFNFDVRSSSVQSNGKIIVGGSFTTYQGNSINRIVILNTDGTYDSSFNNIGNGFNNLIYSSVIQSDGKIILGGEFTTYNPPLINRIARLNTDGSLDTSFNIKNGFNSGVRTTPIRSDGKIIVGGEFTTYQAIFTNFVARLNTDASYDSSFNIGAGFNSNTWTTSIQSDGKIIVGGAFTTYQGTTRNRIVRLNTDGSYDTTFNTGAGFNLIVYTSSIQSDGKIIVGGAFTTYQGVSRNRIARLNTDGSLDTSFDPGTGFNSDVYTSCIQSDGKVIVGGLFTTYQGTIRNRIVRLNTDGSFDSTFNIGTGFNNTLWTTSIQSDGKIIVGGAFTTYQGTTRNRIVRLNPSGNYDNTFNIRSGFDGIVYNSSII